MALTVLSADYSEADGHQPAKTEANSIRPMLQSSEASSRTLSQSTACPVTDQKLLSSMEHIHKASRSRSESSMKNTSALSREVGSMPSKESTSKSQDILGRAAFTEETRESNVRHLIIDVGRI